MKWTAVIGLAAAASSLLRIIEVGFLPIMALHVALAAYLTALHFQRKRVPYVLRAGSIIGVMVLAAIAGHVSFGTPTRIEFFVAASIMAAVFFGERIGIFLAAASVLTIALIYGGFASGVIAPPTPPPPLSITHWITNGASIIFATIAPLLAVSRYRIYLNNERERLLAANRAKSDFMATMSHELRTPMSAILGLSDILLADQPPGPARDKIGRIAKAGRLLLDLLTDILDFAKIEANAVSMQSTPFNPTELVQEICDLFALLAAEKGLTIRSHFAPDLHEALATDAGRLRQVVLNLVGNAVKFTERGQVEVKVSDERRATSLWLLIAVSDSGIGISEDQQARLFEPFMQVEQGMTRRHGGTGLGLAISRRFTELMGGTISLRSAVNEGSTFTVAVPVAPAMRPQPAAQDGLSSAAPTAGLQILVADDNESMRMIVETVLRAWGHTVDSVHDGAAAVEAAGNKTYDAILMDMQMPRMDGVEAAQAIRKIDSAKQTPIIAVTADVSPENRIAYLAAGFAALVTKPVNWNELGRLLSAHAHPKVRANPDI